MVKKKNGLILILYCADCVSLNIKMYLKNSFFYIFKDITENIEKLHIIFIRNFSRIQFFFIRVPQKLSIIVNTNIYFSVRLGFKVSILLPAHIKLYYTFL